MSIAQLETAISKKTKHGANANRFVEAVQRHAVFIGLTPADAH